MVLEVARTTNKFGVRPEVRGEKKSVAEPQWRNLDQGTVHTQDTSFVAEQTEVAEIVKGLEERAWPDVWYELVQGAFEYNDWDKGPPEVIITYEDGESVPLSVFVHQWPQTNKSVARVAIINHIFEDTGLRPSNTYLTHHQEKAGETAFGKHGRGLKGAFTAIVSQKLAEKVTFESYASDIGSWFGQARMAADKVDPRAPDHYQVVYKTTQQEQVGLTTITVERPNDLMLRALRQLPEWFLPLNQNYQYSPFFSEEFSLAKSKTLNRTMLQRFDSPKANRDFYSDEGAQYVEDNLPFHARAEILSKDLIPGTPNGLIDWLYVDGWRVGSQDKQFANIYAFSGFKNNVDQSRKPERSNDSLWVNGDYAYLLKDLLYFTDDPEVFYRIFQYGWNNNDCAEWSQAYLDPDVLRSFPDTLLAITKGWERFLRQRAYPAIPYITTSNSDAITAQKYKIPVLLVGSSAWANVLFATGKARSLNAFLEMEAEKQRAEAEDRLKELGILKEAVGTGEIVKIKRQDLGLEEKKRWLSEIAHILALYEGSCSYDSNGVFRLQLNKKAVDGTSYGQLNELGKLISYLYSLFGAVISTRVEVHQSHEATYLNFNFNGSQDSFGTHSLAISQGQLVQDSEKGVEVGFQLNTLNRDVTKADKKALDNFFSQIMKELQSISDANGRINLEAYQASELASHHPQAHLLLKIQRQQQDITTALQNDLAKLNAIRAKAGLPLKTDKDFLPVDQKVTIGTSIEKKPQQIDSGRSGLFSFLNVGQGRSVSDFDDRRETSPTLDGPRTYAKKIGLGHPDGQWGLSTKGDEEALLQLNEEKNWYEKLQQRLRDAMEESLKALVDPDVSFSSGSGSFEYNRYLVHSIDSSFSSVSFSNYEPLPKIEQKRRSGLTALTFNKPDPSTKPVGLPCPYGYQPVGYFSPDGSEVFFSGIRERGVFAFRSEKGIPAGLTVYFEPIPDFGDRNAPDEYESAAKVIEDNLEPHWQNLIAGLRASSLTDKQKIDALLRAWKRNQRYKKTQSTFDQYRGMSGLLLATTVANLAEGNCGYIDLGFIGLVSTLMPSRSIKSFLFGGNGFDVNPARHGLSQVFIDGRWVAIEAQGKYVESGFVIESVPEPERESIEALINAVPDSLASLAGGGLEAISSDDPGLAIERSRMVPSLALAALLGSLKAAGINVESWLEKNRNTHTNDLSDAEWRKIMLQWGVASGMAVAAGLMLEKVGWKLADIMVTYRFAVEGTPAAEIFDRIHNSLDFLDNQKLMAVIICLSLVTAFSGGYIFRALQGDSQTSSENVAVAKNETET